MTESPTQSNFERALNSLLDAYNHLVQASEGLRREPQGEYAAQLVEQVACVVAEFPPLLRERREPITHSESAKHLSLIAAGAGSLYQAGAYLGSVGRPEDRDDLQKLSHQVLCLGVVSVATLHRLMTDRDFAAIQGMPRQ